MGCTAGNAVAVTIRNAGDAAEQRSANVSVLIGGQVRTTNQVQLDLAPNESVTFPTDQVVTAPTTAVQVTLLGSPTDIDASDNTASCSVQGGRTPTPQVSTPVATKTPSENSTPAPTATATVQTVSP
jgi:hypothetical protein